MKEDDGTTKSTSEAAQTRERIIKRAALEFKDGMYGIFSNKIIFFLSNKIGF